MDMSPYLSLIGTLVGGALTLLGTFASQKVLASKEKRKLICEKCERIYELCQRLYDGHFGEVQKLKNSKDDTPVSWIKKRKHPGEYMSELKMLVKMYAPTLQLHLDTADISHQQLKQKFRKVDSDFLKNESVWIDREALFDDLGGDLDLLGIALNDVKLFATRVVASH